MTTIEIKGVKYQLGKLNAISQFHVSRRIAPVFVAIGVPLQSLMGGMKMDLGDMAMLLEPVANIMAKMPDEDVNYILYTCLSVVRREQLGKFAPVTTGTSLMFEDIDMPTMIRLVIEVLRDNLGNFLLELGAAPDLTSS